MSYDSGDHATEETLEQYSLGTLPDRELESFEEHLLVCPSCQDRLAATDRFIRAFRSAALAIDAAPPPSAADFIRRAVRALLRPAPAAILGLAVLAVLIVWRIQATRVSAIASVPVVLQTHRGIGLHPAPAGVPLALQLDAAGLPELPEYAVEVVDSEGGPVCRLPGRRSGGRIGLIAARDFAAGSYWVRVSDSSGRLLREYGLTVSEDAAR